MFTLVSSCERPSACSQVASAGSPECKASALKDRARILTDTAKFERQHRWLGHVSRMDFVTRIPRRMLSSWVHHKRPRGAPRMTYGRTMSKSLKRLGIWDSWTTLVHNAGEGKGPG